MWLLLGLLIGLSNSTKTPPVAITAQATLQMSDISCQIAVAQSAQITYIYRCASCPASDSASFESLEQLLHRCVASRLPSCMRSLEAHELEPLRQTASMNIFHIPGGDTGQPLVRRILDMLNPKQPRRHYHKYLFIWPGASEQQLKELFMGCWQKQLLFALAITKPGDIYDFQPFSDEGLQLTNLSPSSEVFYIDKLRNWRGSELRFSMFSHPLRALPLKPVESAGYDAIDGTVARLMAQQLNATARYVAPPDGEAYGRCLPNGSFSGVVHDLLSGDTHIGLNLRFVMDCVLPHVESLYPYVRGLICLVVPAAGMQPEYLIFVSAFHSSVWHFLLANFLIVLMLFAGLQWLLWRIIGQTGRWYDIFELFFKTLLGQPVDRFSRNSSIRTFLMGWILFSYVLTTIYFGKLESSFVQPSYQAQVDTLDELTPGGLLSVHGINTLFDAVNTSLSERHYNLLAANRQEHPLKDSDSFYELSVSRRNRRDAFIMRDDKAKEFLALTYNSDVGRSVYHIVKQYLRSMPNTYILPQGSPFRYKFQGMLSAFFEHGLLDYWWRMDVLRRSRASSQSDEFFEDLNEQTYIQAEDADSEEWRKKRVVLTLDILQGAFFLWIIGIHLSMFSFLLEQGYFHWHRSKYLSPI
ncbi:uncharacterized protein LOC116805215 [Drosophila grimshawi]|uniref:uncharacterized protein LOC116805215 n=1 Tax=Drosophila grimshawi TaxID=7222 RepID=UPI000C871656|nr:uncharacterized protein LOC116805215 [Drosophila grimshawi]